MHIRNVQKLQPNYQHALLCKVDSERPSILVETRCVTSLFFLSNTSESQASSKPLFLETPETTSAVISPCPLFMTALNSLSPLFMFFTRWPALRKHSSICLYFLQRKWEHFVFGRRRLKM